MPHKEEILEETVSVEDEDTSTQEVPGYEGIFFIRHMFRLHTPVNSALHRANLLIHARDPFSTQFRQSLREIYKSAFRYLVYGRHLHYSPGMSMDLEETRRFTPYEAFDELCDLNADQLDALEMLCVFGLRGEVLRLWKVASHPIVFAHQHRNALVYLISQQFVEPINAVRTIIGKKPEELESIYSEHLLRNGARY